MVGRVIVLLLVVGLLACLLVGAEDACDGGLKLCDWKAWEPWTPCNKECGAGVRTRSRGLCCAVGETMDKCLKQCQVQDTSFESQGCENICPAGNCTSEEITDTGIDATNFAEIRGGPQNAILNTPVQLNNDFEKCQKACFNMDLGGGLHCWSFTYNDKDKCRLYFYSKPLIIANPGKKGQSPGQSVYVRHCSETVECQATYADIIFVVDSSGSIGGYYFEMIKTFLEGVVAKFDVDPDLTRIGMLVFNDAMRWQFKLGQKDTLLDVLKSIKKTQYIVGGTLTSDAFETIRTEGFLTNRTGAPKIVVVVTDGLSRYPSLTRVRASMLRHLGIQIYAIGVGDQINHEELYNMVSSPEENHIFTFDNFTDLDPSNVSIQTSFLPCKVKHIYNTTTPTTTMLTDNCTDELDNCQSYGNDVCTDFGPWAHKHCSLFCGFCTRRVTTDGVCYDKIPNCASYGRYVCEDRAYVDWANSNCRKYCGICASSEKTTTTTTPLPTTTVKICQDTIDNCAGYMSYCNDTQYHGFLNARCPAACGYCQSHKTVAPSVVSGIKCPEWTIPTECHMIKVGPDCCPLPRCPGDSYFFTADKPI